MQHAQKIPLKRRTREDVITFFIFPSEEFRNGVEAVAMDMIRNCCSEVLETLPDAKSVIARFHLSQLFHNQVDDARKYIQNKARKEDGNKQKEFVE